MACPNFLLLLCRAVCFLLYFPCWLCEAHFTVLVHLVLMALCLTIPDPQHETSPLLGKNLPKTLFNSMLNISTESVGVLFLTPAHQTLRKPLTLSTQHITSFTTGSRSFGSNP